MKKCTCQFNEAKKYIKSGLVHNHNCPMSKLIYKCSKKGCRNACEIRGGLCSECKKKEKSKKSNQSKLV